MTDATSCQSKPFFPSTPVKTSPGVIGEGRKITKTPVDTNPSSSERFSITKSSGIANSRQHVNPRLMRAKQIIAQQPGVYSTVPPTGWQYKTQQSWQQSAADDMLHEGINTWSTPTSAHVQPKLFGSHLNPKVKHTFIPPAWSEPAMEENHSDDEDDETSLRFKDHPNKYPVQIECHNSKYCLYRRQQSRSGYKIVHLNKDGEAQQIRYYQKDLVRICQCGLHNSKDGSLAQGSTVEEPGYEIHYSQKCKWKAYDDFKTGKRVLIRLCKCYAPVA